MFQPDKQRDAQFEREKGVRLKKITQADQDFKSKK